MRQEIIGLILSSIAGMATTLGGGVVFFLKDYKVLPFAMCMAASAAVMMYISFVELFSKSIFTIQEGLVLQHHYEEKRASQMAYLYTTLSFFVGWIMTSILNKLINCILNENNVLVSSTMNSNDLLPKKMNTNQNIIPSTCSESEQHYFTIANVTTETASAEKVSTQSLWSINQQNETEVEMGNIPNDDDGTDGFIAIRVASPPTPICTSNEIFEPLSIQKSNTKCEQLSDKKLAIELKDLKLTASDPKYQKPSDDRGRVIIEQQNDTTKELKNFNLSEMTNGCETTKKKHRCLHRVLFRSTETSERDMVALAIAESNFQKSQHSFARLGIMTAIALTIHNFPEGLATYAGTVASPSFGIGIAVAVGIHNIPEGFAVAVPIYFGTTSKWKGFWCSFLSGIAEPIGAFIAFLSLRNNTNPVVYGILFASIAGIMTNIALQELYPTAIRYDPTDRAVTKTFFISLTIMASTLTAFKFGEM